MANFSKTMKLGALFSGGKDSTYSIYLAKQQGHEIKCLLSISPKSDESHLLHHPNLQWTRLQSESMNIPQLLMDAKSDDTKIEMSSLKEILQKAKNEFGIEGLLHGGIQSQFQKQKFEYVCNALNLVSLAPLWKSDPKKYMNNLLSANFDFIITTVSSDGLDDSWLGRKITKNDIESLIVLAEKFGFNLNFEGGEAETFVVNCPLFSNPIKIEKGKKEWDGYRGRFEIVEARLDYNA
jgi:ABC transporter with metal-binding/Fe-S-binding domain ATP-binding protein